MISGLLSVFADEIAREEKAQVFAIRIDCSESRSVKEAFEGVLSLGFVEVLIYNAYHPVSLHPTNLTDIRIDSFEKSVFVSSIGAFLCAQQVPIASPSTFKKLYQHVFTVFNFTLGSSWHGGKGKGDNSVYWVLSFSQRHGGFL